MTYTITEQLLLRMPVKSPRDYFMEQQHFLNDSFFLAAVRVATPAFYQSLKRHDFHFLSLTEKELITMQKYINRYCFRPTHLANCKRQQFNPILIAMTSIVAGFSDLHFLSKILQGLYRNILL